MKVWTASSGMGVNGFHDLGRNIGANSDGCDIERAKLPADFFEIIEISGVTAEVKPPVSGQHGP